MNNLSEVERPLPAVRSFTQPFWDATREKRFLVQYDKVAQAYQFHPRATSIYTGKASNLEWREVSGMGKVFDYTFVRRARPPFREHEPFWLAMVTLDEGVNVMSNIVNCPVEQMKTGLHVKPFWTPLSDGRNLLLFEPA
ncbi:MAG: Zn-ribbon domain-containing OB-fold protein [Sphingobium sp.]